MGTIIRTVHVKHDNGHLLDGLLHYVMAASNHAAKAYRRGVRGKDLYRAAVHRTHVYQSRYADYIVRSVCGNHKSWRTHKLVNPHARAPHYHNAAAQTDYFELAFDDTCSRWKGTPAIHVAVYGMGRPNKPWMAFPVPPYMVERLTRPGVKPKTVWLRRDKIYVTYEEHIPDRKPVAWAGVDMNANNNTYACTDGTVIVAQNDYAKQYNKAYSKILRVNRRGDVRIMKECAQKAWNTCGNRVRNNVCVEARTMASMGYGIGYEILSVHRLYTKNGPIAPFVRGQLKSTLNTGQRRRALINAVESEGLPHQGVDPAGTSAMCFACNEKLKRLAIRQAWNGRYMWCQSCHRRRERDANAGVNILFRTIMALIMDATGQTGRQTVKLHTILSLLNGAIANPCVTRQQKIMFSDIMRLLEGRSADTDWCLRRGAQTGASKSRRR